MVAVFLIATISIGFPSCGKDKIEPEPDLSGERIMGKWYKFPVDKRYGLEFKTDNTFPYKTESESINGLYKIKEKETDNQNEVRKVKKK